MRDRCIAVWRWLAAPSHRFVPLFLIYLWILTSAAGRLPHAAVERLLSVTAWLDYQLLGLVTDGVQRSGMMVRYEGFGVEIITECTGLFESLILAAAVLAYPARWRERALGIVGGSALLYGMNVLRIAFLLVIGRHAPSLFDFAHVYFWQTLLVVFITAIWLGWIHLCVRNETGPAVRA